MSARAHDTSCRKCGAPMKPLSVPPPGSSRALLYGYFGPVTITAYRCDCGHWNDLKRRKGAKKP